jgi:hypothetical protein
MSEVEQEFKRILYKGTDVEKRALFAFDNESEEIIRFKFQLWARFFFPDYFQSEDAKFHDEIDLYNIRCYLEEYTFVDIAFRGAAKTARTKLFLAYAVANDLQHRRKYLKVISQDLKNAKQIVTDIYNMLINPRVTALYPEIFEKTDLKREKTMGSFTTVSSGVKMASGTGQQSQRGNIQEASRPDFIWFEDFETRETLRSAVKTQAIWDNMEEARTGLAKGGSCVYTCNYISESGNVHKLVINKSDKKKVLIIPIIEDETLKDASMITWPERYTLEDIVKMKKEDDDFEGERLCKPSASRNVYFDRSKLNEQVVSEPIDILNGLRVYSQCNPSHNYAAGHDIAGGVGYDSSTTVIIDFSCYPCEVVATYNNNLIKPDIFGYEIEKQISRFGNCLTAPESNNHGHATIAILKQLGVNIYKTSGKDDRLKAPKPVKYGWDTNSATKPRMLSALAKAIEDGHLILNDQMLIDELKSYTRDDSMDSVPDPRLTTRHFDLLMACAIAWQMKDERLDRTKRVKTQKARIKRNV